MPFLIPLHSQCTMVEPSSGIIALTQRLEKQDGVVSVSYLAGFPPSDLFQCGPCVVVHATTQEIADRVADEAARHIALKEAEFAVPVLSPAEAVAGWWSSHISQYLDLAHAALEELAQELLFQHARVREELAS